jgi:hypothetical protein
MFFKGLKAKYYNNSGFTGYAHDVKMVQVGNIIALTEGGPK